MASPLFRSAALGVQRALNRFDPLRLAFDPAVVDADELAPIFIIGPPRTGSTYIYQALVDLLEVGYISNAMAVAPHFMIATQYLMTRVAGRYRVPYARGDWGFVPGVLAPSEAGKVMDRWFDPSFISSRRDAVRRMFAAMTRVAGAPLLIKSLSLVLKLEAVLEMLPRARFLVIGRSPRAIVASLLSGRDRSDLHAEQFEALEPPGFAEHAERGLVFQVAWQVRTLVDLVETAMQRVDARRVHRTTYESFFAAPEDAVRSIGQRCALRARSRRHPPPSMVAGEPTPSARLGPSVVTEIEEVCRELGLEGEHAVDLP